MRARPIVAWSLLLALGACARPPAVLPPDSAPPAVVLDAYLTALVAGDCSAAKALATAGFGDGLLCGGSLRVTAFHVSAVPATARGGEVVFSLDISTTGGGYEMRDGGHTWFYTLIQQPTGVWRVSGGGSGP